MVDIAVEADASGATRFTRMMASGGLAVRRTSSSGVHLVGTAAGPIGDDRMEISIVVGRGATLSVSGVAATICLPGASGGTSLVSLSVMQHSESLLHCQLPPVIVCRGADVFSTTEVITESSSLTVLDEQVSLGRAGEPGGAWSSRLVADVQGRPALRQTQTSQSVLAAISRSVSRPVDRGAIVTRLEMGARDAWTGPTVDGLAMRLSLAVPGALIASAGTDLRAAERHLASLAAPANGHLWSRVQH